MHFNFFKIRNFVLEKALLTKWRGGPLPDCKYFPKIYSNEQFYLWREHIWLNTNKTHSTIKNTHMIWIDTSLKKIHKEQKKMKIYSTAWVIGQMLIKITMRHHYTLWEWPKLKRLTSNVGKDGEKRFHLYNDVSR